MDSVKKVWICHAYKSNVSRSKEDVLISNKVICYVFVFMFMLVMFSQRSVNNETASPVSANELSQLNNVELRIESSVSGELHGDLLCFCVHVSVGNVQPRSVNNETAFLVSADESSHHNNVELHTERNIEDNTTTRSRTRGHGKSCGRSHNHSGHGLAASSPQSSCLVQCEASINTNKQAQ
ncbi:uncharacterized protein LOC113360558 [Papaver somniferum]|uniref:uncharacterized protein LOC113360558 n=1 Tax=Papaver somniferum TaxID=3469 RepID=UPI000E6F6E07|nr:uncharacterized protein LOC113360558 [Papaver somniferum]